MSTRLKRIALGALIIITIVAVAPVAAVVVAYQIADAFGCRLDEGGVYPCLAHGRDIGPLLSTLSAFGWLMLFTFPFIVLTAIVWLVLIVRIVRRRFTAGEA